MDKKTKTVRITLKDTTYDKLELMSKLFRKPKSKIITELLEKYSEDLKRELSK